MRSECFCLTLCCTYKQTYSFIERTPAAVSESECSSSSSETVRSSVLVPFVFLFCPSFVGARRTVEFTVFQVPRALKICCTVR